MGIALLIKNARRCNTNIIYTQWRPWRTAPPPPLTSSSSLSDDAAAHSVDGGGGAAGGAVRGRAPSFHHVIGNINHNKYHATATIILGAVASTDNNGPSCT
jgi:hypothetical protein